MEFMKQTGLKNAFVVAIAVGIVVLLAGCQTMVPVTYTEPARLNMSGVTNVVIFSNNSATKAAVSAALTGTGKYTVTTDDSEIAEFKQWQNQQSLLSEAIEISASDLVKAYTSNAARASSIYKGEILKVSGTVTEIQERAIRLGVGNDSVDVYIAKSESVKVASLEKGAAVVMVGTCYGLDSPDSKDTAEILRILGGGKHVNIVNTTFYIPTYTGKIDAVLSLETTSSVNEKSKEEKRPAKNADGEILKDADGKTIYKTVQTYCKVATATVAYKAVRFDGIPIGSGKASGSASTSYYEDRSKLTDSSSLINSAMKKPLQDIISDMVPTKRTLSVQLAKSNNKDKEFKVSMSEAQKLVKKEKYSAAADAYGKIYAQTKDFAAGYNQAVITEVAYGTSKAVVLMEALAKTSGNPEAQSMLKKMQVRNAANQRAAEQLKK